MVSRPFKHIAVMILLTAVMPAVELSSPGPNCGIKFDQIFSKEKDSEI